jgi:hypothetical protein
MFLLPLQNYPKYTVMKTGTFSLAVIIFLFFSFSAAESNARIQINSEVNPVEMVELNLM